MVLSWRLWQTLAEPASRNPIFNFVRDKRKSQAESTSFRPVTKWLGIIALILSIVALIREPGLIFVAIQIPLLLVVVIVVSPLFLPLFAIFAGGYLVNKIILRIHQEKRQFTYELLCASPEGALHANWSFASGLLHRDDWFQWLKIMTLLSYKFARVAVIGLIGLVAVLLLIGDSSIGYSQVYMLVTVALGVALFYTNLHQSLALSMTIGLFSSSLESTRRDATIIGLLTYFFAQLTPFLVALLVYILIQTMLPMSKSILDIVAITLTAMSIYVVRESFILVMWQGLKYRLNSTTDNTDVITPDTTLHPSIFTVT